MINNIIPKAGRQYDAIKVDLPTFDTTVINQGSSESVDSELIPFGMQFITNQKMCFL